jgi:hypothetical protein
MLKLKGDCCSSVELPCVVNFQVLQEDQNIDVFSVIIEPIFRLEEAKQACAEMPVYW